jgi:hypothetical protein
MNTEFSLQEKREQEALSRAYEQDLRVALVGDVLIDIKTGLMWYHLEIEALPSRNWMTAAEFCKSLSSGGYYDWRLPTLQEYEGLFVSGLLTISANTERYVFWSSDRSGNAAAAYDGKALRPLNGYLALHAESKILTFVPVRTHTRDISKQSVLTSLQHGVGMQSLERQDAVVEELPSPRQPSLAAQTVMPPSQAQATVFPQQHPAALLTAVPGMVQQQEQPSIEEQSVSLASSSRYSAVTVQPQKVASPVAIVPPKVLSADPTILPPQLSLKREKKKLPARNHMYLDDNTPQ